MKRTIVMGCLLGALLLPLSGCADVLDRAGERSDTAIAAPPKNKTTEAPSAIYSGP